MNWPKKAGSRGIRGRVGPSRSSHPFMALSPIPVNEQQELTTKTQGYAKGFLFTKAGIGLLDGIGGPLLFFAHLYVLGVFI